MNTPIPDVLSQIALYRAITQQQPYAIAIINTQGTVHGCGHAALCQAQIDQHAVLRHITPTQHYVVIPASIATSPTLTGANGQATAYALPDGTIHDATPESHQQAINWPAHAP